MNEGKKDIGKTRWKEQRKNQKTEGRQEGKRDKGIKGRNSFNPAGNS